MRYIGIGLVFILVGLSLAQQKQSPSQQTTEQLQWTATAIPNLKMAVVSGNPAAKGPFVFRLRAEKDVQIPPHWHPADEEVTLINGSAALGKGDRFAATATRKLKVGEKTLLSKESRHFASLGSGTEIEVRGEGPFTNEWVDPTAIKSLQKDVDSNSERSKMKAEQDKQ